MKSNSAENSGQAQAWYRRRKRFIGIALSVSLLIGSVLVGLSLSGLKPQANNLTSFTCRQSSSNQTFTIALEVNLTDGMDQNEAIKVATEVFAKATEMNAKKDIRITGSRAFMSEDGTWMTEIYYAEMVVTEPVHQTHIARRVPIFGNFEAVVNPLDNTVVYSFK